MGEDEPGSSRQHAAAAAAAQPGQAELYFLMAHALAAGPLAGIGETLAREAGALGLLPMRTDVQGGRHPLTFAELQQRYSHVPPTALDQALRSMLAHTVQAAPHVGRRGLTSLLEGTTLFGQPSPLLPRWTLPPASNRRGGKGLSPVQLLLLREGGAAAQGAAAPASLPVQRYASLLQHQQTVRGHRFVAYCVVLDKQGQYIITGADDRLVKIWSVATGLLLCTCRGHIAEVSDLSINATDTLLASASLDATVRVWQLRGPEGGLGTPVAVLQGHQKVITSLAFSPVQPDVLLSASLDGTCRLWNARDSEQPPLVLHVSGDQFGGARGTPWLEAGGGRRIRFVTRNAERLQQGEASGQAADGGALGPSGEGEDRRQRSRRGMVADAAVAGAAAGAVSHEAEDADHHEEEEGEGATASPQALVCKFTPDGSHIIVGSNDCSAYVWRWPAPVPAPAAMPGEEPVQQKALQAPPVAGGEWPPALEVCRLEGHRNDVYLLYPSNSGQLLATGSKDGTVRIWRRPRRVRRRGGSAAPAAWELASTIACPPDEEAMRDARRRRRPVPTQRVDQVAWSCDDALIAITIQDSTVRVFEAPSGRPLHVLTGHDEAVHVLLAHPTRPELAISAGYGGQVVVWDLHQGVALRSFNSRNTRPGGCTWSDPLPFVDGFVAHDGNRFALTDAAGQLHIFGLGPPCPLTARAPYDQFLSTDFDALLHDDAGTVVAADTQILAHIRTGRETMVDITGNPYPLPFQHAYREGRLLAASPQEADWQETGHQAAHLTASPMLTAAAWRVSMMDGSQVALENAVHRAQERLQVHDALVDAFVEYEDGVPGAGDGQQQQQSERGRGRQRRQPPRAAMEDGGLSEEEEDEEGSSMDDDEDEERRDARVRHSQRLAARRPSSQRTAQRSAARRPPAISEEQQREAQRQAREERAQRRLLAHEHALEQQRQRRQRTQAARRVANGGRLGREDQDEFYLSYSEEEEEEEEEEEAYSDVSLEAEYSEEDAEEEYGGAAGPSSGRRRAAQRPPPSEHRRERKYRRTDRAPAAGGPRALETYSWLASHDFMPGVYVPQTGDRVVYVREGHAAVLASTNDKRLPPWQTVRRGRSMRPLEPCVLEEMQYVQSQDGMESTVVRATLRLEDFQSPLHGQRFAVELPAPSTGHPDFVVHRGRFDAAIAENFSLYYGVVQAFWPDHSGPGQWWRGQIVADKRSEEGLPPVQADPFGCGQLWEQFTVNWDGIANPGGDEEADPGAAAEWRGADPTSHAPWELYPLETTAQGARLELPRLDDELVTRLTHVMHRASCVDQWSIFQAAPEWDEAYRSLSGRPEFYNRRVLLPMGLMDITARLASDFYRQTAAVLHDVQTIADNAEAFNGPDSDIAADAKALAAYLRAVIEAGGGEEVDMAFFVDLPQREREQREGQEQDRRMAEELAAEMGSQRENGVWQQGPSRRSARRAAAQPQQQQPEQQQQQQAREGGGGRYGLRHAGRQVYRDDVDISDLEEEEGWGEEVRPSRRRPAAPPPQHAYSTRRARQAAGAPAEEQAAAGGRPHRIVIRLRSPQRDSCELGGGT